MLKKGYAYKKCGVALLDLSRPENLQGDLFQSPVVGNMAVMDTLDASAISSDGVQRGLLPAAGRLSPIGA
jgi:hypothetical protein